jgi:hypothetical protein
MYFFDSEYLQQYLNQGKDVKVTVDNKVLTLTDESDVEDPQQGVGYDQSGDSSFFEYNDIEQIQVGPNIITLDLLQKTMTNDPSKQKEPSKPPAKPEEDEEPPEEEEPEQPEPKEKKPDKGVEKANFDIYMLGRQLINESRKKR